MEHQKIAELIRTSNDLDFAFVLELWDILQPNGTNDELAEFLKACGYAWSIID